MILSLRIKNYGIIDDIEMEFTTGVNTITGETGAGKSIIIDALSLTLGEKADTSKVKNGKAKSYIECVFGEYPEKINDILEEIDIEPESQLFLRRVINANGKSSAYINGIKVQVSDLKKIGDLLVDQHGQNTHQSLLKSSSQLFLIDRYGSLDKLREEVKTLYNNHVLLTEEIGEIKKRVASSEERKYFLQFQIEELEQANIIPGEKENIQNELKILENTELLRKNAQYIYSILYDAENSIMDTINTVKSKLEEMCEIDNTLDTKSLSDIEYGIESLADSMRNYFDIESDGEHLRELRDRMDLILQLETKYHRDADLLEEYRNELQKELDGITTDDTLLEKKEEEKIKIKKELLEKSELLSQKRKRIKKELEKRIKDFLPKVGMPHAYMDIQISNRNSGLNIDGTFITKNGMDDISMIFYSNPGQKGLPLSKIASGGELSRIMLALKSIFADVDYIPVMVFDEIDAGIGGETANKVAKAIKDISSKKQIIMITHLPQMALIADRHFIVEKKATKTYTNVIVKQLSEQEREEEIKRMVGGKDIVNRLKGGK